MHFKLFVENKIETQLKQVAKKQLEEFPDTDYGKLFWNRKTKTVHWVCGDSAGGYSEAEKRFSKIPGIKDVVVADEYFPSKDDPNWKEISVKK